LRPVLHYFAGAHRPKIHEDAAPGESDAEASQADALGPLTDRRGKILQHEAVRLVEEAEVDLVLRAPSFALVTIIFSFARHLGHGFAVAGWTKALAPTCFIGRPILAEMGVLGLYLGKHPATSKSSLYARSASLLTATGKDAAAGLDAGRAIAL
jgi:hypothetical protein